MNADGSDATRLADSPAFDAAPVWFPHGTKIAFDSDRDGGKAMLTDSSGRDDLAAGPLVLSRAPKREPTRRCAVECSVSPPGVRDRQPAG